LKLHPDELKTDSGKIQEKTFRILPDNDIILYRLALVGKSSYLISWHWIAELSRDYAG